MTANQPDPLPHSNIDWAQMKESLPETAWPQLEEVQKAYESDLDEPARAVELALREKVSGLRMKFEALKGGGK
jgi:hypothetical protein